MHRRTCNLLWYAALVALVVPSAAESQDSVYEHQEQSFESEAYSDLLTIDESSGIASTEPLAETFLAPSLDITANGVVSNIPRTAWHTDLELVAFRAEYGNIDFTEKGEDVYYVTPRITLGWESNSGNGVRGRLWGYEAETEMFVYEPAFAGGFATMRGFDFRGASPADSGMQGYFLRTGSLDVDFYKRFAREQTSLVLGAGLKSAALQVEIPGLTENTAYGTGLGLFSDVRHVLYQTGQSELSLVGSGRVGFLTGEWRNETTETFVSAAPSSPGDPGGLSTTTETTTTVVDDDADMVISEASLGVEWRRNLGWSVLTLRAQYETQLWNTDVTDDLTFNGGAVKAGLAW